MLELVIELVILIILQYEWWHNQSLFINRILHSQLTSSQYII